MIPRKSIIALALAVLAAPAFAADTAVPATKPIQRHRSFAEIAESAPPSTSAREIAKLYSTESAKAYEEAELKYIELAKTYEEKGDIEQAKIAHSIAASLRTRSENARSWTLQTEIETTVVKFGEGTDMEPPRIHLAKRKPILWFLRKHETNHEKPVGKKLPIVDKKDIASLERGKDGQIAYVHRKDRKLPDKAYSKGIGKGISYLHRTETAQAVPLAVLTEKDAETVRRTLQGQKGFHLASAPRVTTQEKKKATIRLIRELPLFDAERDAYDIINVGVSVDVVPTIDSKDNARLDMGFKHCGFIYREKIKGTPVPLLREREYRTDVTVPDGATVLFGGLADIADTETPTGGRRGTKWLGYSKKSEVTKLLEELPNMTAESGAGKYEYYFLVTPRILDPEGRPVSRSATPKSPDIAKPPTQFN